MSRSGLHAALPWTSNAVGALFLLIRRVREISYSLSL